MYSLKAIKGFKRTFYIQYITYQETWLSLNRLDQGFLNSTCKTNIQSYEAVGRQNNKFTQ